MILLIAHGSRLSAANDEVRNLATKLQKTLNQKTSACFLEIAKPSIPQALEEACKNNPEKIIILPYFLTQGRHVKTDVPRQIKQVAKAYPHIPIKLLNYLGAEDALVDLLAKMLQLS